MGQHGEIYRWSIAEVLKSWARNLILCGEALPCLCRPSCFYILSASTVHPCARRPFLNTAFAQDLCKTFTPFVHMAVHLMPIHYIAASMYVCKDFIPTSSPLTALDTGHSTLPLLMSRVRRADNISMSGMSFASFPTDHL